MLPDFLQFDLPKALYSALSDMSITTPTPIQEQVFKQVLAGNDLVGLAQTGTGKTLAYLLPCIRLWRYTKDKHPQILIIVPTRELVAQVADAAKALTTYMSVRVSGIYGGVNMASQQEVVVTGSDILIATPGRLLDFVLKGTIRLRAVRVLVLDEADEMLAQGLRHQVEQILDLLPEKHQSLLFSATLLPDVEILVHKYFQQPVIVSADTGISAAIAITGYTVPNFYTKYNLLQHLLDHDVTMRKVLIFVATKKMADRLAALLQDEDGETPDVLHGNKAQSQRFQYLDAFQQGKKRVLICTDIAARGIDFSGVTHVVNFNIPENPEAFIHRIGRTGRHDQRGIAICFVADEELDHLVAIETLIAQTIPLKILPVEVELSSELLPEEKPSFKMKQVPVTPVDNGGGAFHEKKLKNRKSERPNLKPREKNRLSAKKKTSRRR